MVVNKNPRNCRFMHFAFAQKLCACAVLTSEVNAMWKKIVHHVGRHCVDYQINFGFRSYSNDLNCGLSPTKTRQQRKWRS